MRVHVYVEGASDVAALNALLNDYREACREAGWGINFTQLRNKVGVLTKVGAHAWAMLSKSEEDHVVAMPDLYPMSEFDSTEYAHGSYRELQDLLRKGLTAHAQREGYTRVPSEMRERCHAFPFSYDLEVLLLASHEELARRLKRKPGSLKNAFRHPAEDQDDRNPPKDVVRKLFESHLKNHRYEAVQDAPAILRKVRPLDIINSGECPKFSAFLSKLEEITEVSLV